MRDYSTGYQEIINEINRLYNKTRLHNELEITRTSIKAIDYKCIKDILGEDEIELNDISYDEQWIDHQDKEGVSQDSNIDIFLGNKNIPLHILTEIEKKIFLLKTIYTDIKIPKDVNKDCIEKKKSFAKIGKELNIHYKQVQRIYYKAVRKLAESEELECVYPQMTANPKNHSRPEHYPYLRSMTQYPCRLMADLEKAFPNSQTACPGYHDIRWNELLCERRRAKPNCNKCNMEECKLTVKEYSAISELGQSTVSKYCKEGILPNMKVRNKYQINCDDIGVCGQEVFNKRLPHKYWVKTELIKCWNNLKRLEHIWITKREPSPKNLSKGFKDKLVYKIEKCREKYIELGGDLEYV